MDVRLSRKNREITTTEMKLNKQLIGVRKGDSDPEIGEIVSEKSYVQRKKTGKRTRGKK